MPSRQFKDSELLERKHVGGMTQKVIMRETAKYYSVKYGETLEDIASRELPTGQGVRDIKAANPAKNIQKGNVYIGQVLRIPIEFNPPM